MEKYVWIINKNILVGCFFDGWEIVNNFLKGSFSLYFLRGLDCYESIANIKEFYI